MENGGEDGDINVKLFQGYLWKRSSTSWNCVPGDDQLSCESTERGWEPHLQGHSLWIKVVKITEAGIHKDQEMTAYAVLVKFNESMDFTLGYKKNTYIYIEARKLPVFLSKPSSRNQKNKKHSSCGVDEKK